VAEDEQHNSSEEAGGHFPFLHFQAALDSAREIQAGLILKASTQNSSVSKAITGSPRRSLSLLAEPWPCGEGAAREEPEEHSANCA